MYLHEIAARKICDDLADHRRCAQGWTVYSDSSSCKLRVEVETTPIGPLECIRLEIFVTEDLRVLVEVKDDLELSSLFGEEWSYPKLETQVSLSLAAPDSFGRLCDRIVSEVFLHNRRAEAWFVPIFADHSLVPAVVQQRLIGLKAVVIARQAVRDENVNEVRKLAQTCVELLKSEDDTDPKNMKALVFFMLIELATVPGDRVLRTESRSIGRRFREFGGFSPLFPYARCVDAANVAEKQRTNTKRRRQMRGSQEYQQATWDGTWSGRERRLVLHASRLKSEEIDQFGWFIEHSTLETIADHLFA